MALPVAKLAARHAAAWAALRQARVRAKQFGKESIKLLVRPHVRLLIRRRARARLSPLRRENLAAEAPRTAVPYFALQWGLTHFLQVGGTWEGYAAAIEAQYGVRTQA
jgi:hypothetical protein